jgi:YidC/Oxa1 family membrane protein insertase
LLVVTPAALLLALYYLLSSSLVKMRFAVSRVVVGLFGVADAFAPSSNFGTHRRNTARSLGLDPSSLLQELPNHVQSLHHALTSISLSDGMDVAGFMDSAAPAAAEVEAVDNGWFGFLTGPTMGLLQLIHGGLVSVGVSADSWGVSIIALTILIKIVTFPLTKTQLESTNKMQVGQNFVLSQKRFQSKLT